MVFDCPLFKTHRIVAAEKEVVIAQESFDDPVAYHIYSGLEVVEKTEEEKEAAKATMEKLIYKRQNPTIEFLTMDTPFSAERAAMQVERRMGGSASPDLSEFLAPKITLSPSIIDPALTPE